MSEKWEAFFQEFGTNEIETYIEFERKIKEDSVFNIETMYQAFKQRFITEFLYIVSKD